MTGAEGIGEAETGGLAAGAVEPEADEAGHEAPGLCLNCGAALTGPYCHRCGQRGHVHRSISAWWHEFVHGVLHLDGKFWRTLPMLAWRPGELTRRYIDGQRARFVSPMAMFLFSVFLIFAVFSLIGARLVGGDPTGLDAGFQEEIRTAESGLRALERQRASAAAENAGPAAIANIDARIAGAREEVRTMRAIREGGPVEGMNVTVPPAWPSWVRKAIEKAAQNPSLLFYKIQANAYKFSWALIPISVPFLWLLFLHRRRYRRGFRAYDHLIFVTYSIAFMSLAFVAFVLLRAPGIATGLLTALFLLVPPVHIYRQLRGAYGVSRFGAAWRTVALVAMAGIALTLFFLLLLALGLLG